MYFQKDKCLIDADIEFFEKRIKEYEKILHINSKKLFIKDISIKQLENFFARSQPTIKRAIYRMLKVNENFRYVKNDEFIISKDGIEWLCKNLFKQKYLEMLEQYKMELTEIYIEAGYIYDNFFI